jgi:mRNA interferase RelE/StbE
MTWEVRQTRRFARAYKKLHDRQAADVDVAVAAVADDPGHGEKKREI